MSLRRKRILVKIEKLLYYWPVGVRAALKRELLKLYALEGEA